jgi:hypothetical protein
VFTRLLFYRSGARHNKIPFQLLLAFFLNKF